jgi:hypothetical protein
MRIKSRGSRRRTNVRSRPPLEGYTVTIAQEDAGDYYGEPTYQYAIRFYDTSGKLLDTAMENDFPNVPKFEGGKTPEKHYETYMTARGVGP